MTPTCALCSLSNRMIMTRHRCPFECPPMPLQMGTLFADVFGSGECKLADDPEKGVWTL